MELPARTSLYEMTITSLGFHQNSCCSLDLLGKAWVTHLNDATLDADALEPRRHRPPSLLREARLLGANSVRDNAAAQQLVQAHVGKEK